MISKGLTSERLCGTRVSGGVYIEVTRSHKGLPLEYFLWCQPQVIVPEVLGLSPVGVHLLPQPTGDKTLHHVFDYIGEGFYPNIWDFLSEGSFIGFSRRIPRNFDFSKLTSESKIFFIHRRAWIENWKEYFSREPEGLGEAARILNEASSTAQFTGFGCPRQRDKHRVPQSDQAALGVPGRHAVSESEMCSRIWRQDLTQAKQEEGRWATRTLPCNGQYQGLLRPEGVTPQYKPAIFACFPIGRLAVVKGPDSKATARKARKSKLPVEEVDL